MVAIVTRQKNRTIAKVDNHATAKQLFRRTLPPARHHPLAPDPWLTANSSAHCYNTPRCCISRVITEKLLLLCVTKSTTVFSTNKSQWVRALPCRTRYQQIGALAAGRNGAASRKQKPRLRQSRV